MQQTKAVKRSTTKRVKHLSIPALSNDLIWSKLNFDISKIKQSLVNNSEADILPSNTCVIYSLKDRKITQVTPSFIAVLGLCDGKNNIKEIATVLGRRYGIPKRIIEDDCILYLQKLADQQLIIVKD